VVTKSMIGQRVTDGEDVGILMAIEPQWTDPASPPWARKTYSLAFVRPVRGGAEWTVDPSELRPVPA
jgi:hypothetical protein